MYGLCCHDARSALRRIELFEELDRCNYPRPFSSALFVMDPDVNPLVMSLAPSFPPEHDDGSGGGFEPFSLATYTDSEFSEVRLLDKFEGSTTVCSGVCKRYALPES